MEAWGKSSAQVTVPAVFSAVVRAAVLSSLRVGPVKAPTAVGGQGLVGMAMGASKAALVASAFLAASALAAVL